MQLTLHETLNRQIANWSVLFVKLHNYHWYVKGQQFFTLHTKFEELYTEAAAHVDALAERLLSLGGLPVATMKGCLELASVGDATGKETAEQMVKSIVDDFETMVGELKTGMKLAESEKDETTGDLLLGIHSSLEKHVWMLNSFLGK
ncbi:MULTISPECIES: Dps family protein [Paenibacillus]|uniref:General stress protein n=1 Tax=Paenibacillus naphthalenovorans TaxID=162209 RepID=A0A0U2UEP2_9BACL|nr:MULTISPECIES: Dps family protein [Paenibacillus]ALS24745.1 general stress protein [Paenibacillus naphthalenovorans]NTZ19635.1 DNA starvation/stationary phase protection protein [Paenibacillus sp. JMULE4]GCL73925.1 DNA starvation/stationary phase protection protein [Paenibacillus naphthalenovorans]SDJ07312.1 starvation-inducible DNA-binding protein [Paenibacillus naphthalenovorans]